MWSCTARRAQLRGHGASLSLDPRVQDLASEPLSQGLIFFQQTIDLLRKIGVRVCRGGGGKSWAFWSQCGAPKSCVVGVLFKQNLYFPSSPLMSTVFYDGSDTMKRGENTAEFHEYRAGVRFSPNRRRKLSPFI